jgi:anthraniloyl-CoA monooxygenase
MRIAVIGGGPAGLYSALLIRKTSPDSEVTVFERNPPDDTFGWGVVFSDQTLENFSRADEPTFRAITENFAHWDDIDVVIRGRRITSSGHGFSGIGRHRLLSILRSRAEELGVRIDFHTELSGLRDLPKRLGAEPDVVIAADGVNSTIRSDNPDWFVPDLDVRATRFIWLGTSYPFDAFTFYFAENEHGVFQAHCYRFDRDTSTFIVECDERSWRRAGFDAMDDRATIEACERMFGEHLQGHRLRSNASHRSADPWSRFTRVRNERWFHGNVVLVGDAAHTAHFSIGSGTKLAMEDAIVLARELTAGGDLERAFGAYQAERMTESLRLQNAARNSMEWFENVKRYVHLEPEQFTYSLLTRSQRVSHENLRLRDARYLSGVERWFASRASSTAAAPADATGAPPPPAPEIDAPGAPPPPMFTPYRLRGVTLPNRVVCSPMDMYSAVDGVPNDFHLVHLGARAIGGAGLVMTEMVCVSPEARITLGCTGMYTGEQREAWGRIVDFVHGWSHSRICLQLGHSGRKGATRLPWDGGERQPLRDDEGRWQIVGPSPVSYEEPIPAPEQMTRQAMDAVRDQFVESTRMAIEAGFDMIELHCAHGYLLSSFLTPVSNLRDDEYGGTTENRLRYPVEVFSAMRAAWPDDRPMSVRISATDWVEDGITAEESVRIAKAFVAAGADIIHVSTGQTTPAAKPVFGRLWQTPYSDRIRNEARIPTIAVGNVTDADQVNSIVAAGRADLVAIGRPHLADPHWTLHAAAQLGYSGMPWPKQYYQGKVQLEREVARAKEMMAR